MEAKDNKTIYIAAVLVLVLIVGLGVVSYKGELTFDNNEVPTVNSVSESVETSATTNGRVTINILPQDNEAPTEDK